MLFQPGYFCAARHPWVAGLFVLSMLGTYELGILFCRPADDLLWRTGLDAGLRLFFRQQGKGYLEWTPSIAAGLVLLLYSCRRWKGRPSETVSTWVGMILESLLLALPLIMLARLGTMNAVVSVIRTPTPQSQSLAALLASIGAGVYEEIAFRLVLLNLLLVVTRFLGRNYLLEVAIPVLVSAVVFAAAHHVPPFQEPYEPRLLVFRTQAGIYFALLYWFRGLGIAAGTHACYDILATFS